MNERQFGPFLFKTRLSEVQLRRAAATFLPKDEGQLPLEAFGAYMHAMNAPMSRNLDRVTPGHFSDWPLALKSILGFWLFYALTVVARAFLGADAWTMLLNKLVVVVIGILLTGLIYVAITMLAAGASTRKKAIVAGLASVVAAWGMAGAFLAIEDLMREPKEVFRYQSREGFVITEKGRTLTVERRAQEPLVVTWPRLGELDANKRVRFAADTAVVWLFFFIAWSA